MSKLTDSDASISRISREILESMRADPNFGGADETFISNTLASWLAIHQLGKLLDIETNRGPIRVLAADDRWSDVFASCNANDLGRVSVNAFIGWCNPTGLDAHKRIKLGVPSEAIDPLAVFLGIGKGEIADLLDLDRSTALRLSRDQKLLPLHAAERVFRLLDLKEMVSDVFEGEDGQNWLKKPHPMLEGETPLQAAKTSFGAQRVKDILNAIKYGGVV